MLSGGADRKRIVPVVAALLTLAVIALVQDATMQAASARSPAPASASAYSVRRVCAAGTPGQARCMALELVPRLTSSPITSAAGARGRHSARAAMSCVLPLAREGCDGLRPEDLRAAYDLPAAAPEPQTIAIVAAGDDPTAAKDLSVYDTEFGLVPCTHQDGCFTKLNGEGNRSPLPAPSVEAAKESSLDVQVSHAVCPNCRILLVEASSNALGAMEAAEDAAAAVGATEISNSWGEAEPPEPSGAGAAFDHPGVVITAAAGDTGYLNWGSGGLEAGHPEYPASSPDVIAVGGTRLELGPASEWLGETVWEGEAGGAGGSACSGYFAAPPWQTALGNWSAVGCGTRRAVADIAADGDPLTGVAVYDSMKGPEGVAPQWRRLGGTSLGAPLVAAAFALAGGAHGVAHPAQTLYEDARRLPLALHDITAGSNGECPKIAGEGCTVAEQQASCAGTAICLAGGGYDGPTGVGSLNGLGALRPLSPLEPQHITFTSSPPAARLGGPSYVIAAEASSGLPVTLRSLTPAECLVAGDTASFVGAGGCTVLAEQPGNGEWEAAPQAEQSFAVAAGSSPAPPPAAGTLSFTGSAAPGKPADSHFTLGPISIDRHHGSFAFAATVAQAGGLRWLLTFANGSLGVVEGGAPSCRPGWVTLKGRCRPPVLVFGQGGIVVGRAGTVRFTVNPDGAAVLALRHALRRHRALRLTALVRFQSALGGAPASSSLVLNIRPLAP